MLKLRFRTRHITDATVFLKDFPPSTLKDVMVEFGGWHMWDINDTLSGEASSRLLEELEQTLLRFTRPRIVCRVNTLRDSTKSFWTQEIGKHFPVLLQRGGFTLTPETGEYTSYYCSSV